MTQDQRWLSIPVLSRYDAGFRRTIMDEVSSSLSLCSKIENPLLGYPPYGSCLLQLHWEYPSAFRISHMGSGSVMHVPLESQDPKIGSGGRTLATRLSSSALDTPWIYNECRCPDISSFPFPLYRSSSLLYPCVLVATFLPLWFIVSHCVEHLSSFIFL